MTEPLRNPVMDIQANGRGGIDNGRYPTPRTVFVWFTIVILICKKEKV